MDLSKDKWTFGGFDNSEDDEGEWYDTPTIYAQGALVQAAVGATKYAQILTDMHNLTGHTETAANFFSVVFALQAGENVTLYGGVGDDTYVFSNGDGHDVIIEEGGFDTVKFLSGVDASTVSYTKSDADLVIHYGTGDDTITVQGFFTDANLQVEQVTFADGTVHDFADIMAQAIGVNGTAGDDVLTGTDDALWVKDYLSGFAGKDTLDGGIGADTMTGGTGNDHYIVDDAGDTIIENSGEGTDSVESSVSYTLPAFIAAQMMSSHSLHI